MDIVVFDTENNALLKADVAGEEQAPRMLEFAAIKLSTIRMIDDSVSFSEIARLTFMVNPRCKITDEVTKITGITDADVQGHKPFPARVPELCRFFLGVEVVVAHNLPYDLKVLEWELTRAGSQFRFPWPPRHICTVEASLHDTGSRQNLQALHTHLTGAGFTGAHRAMTDTEATVTCFKALVAKGTIEL